MLNIDLLNILESALKHSGWTEHYPALWEHNEDIQIDFNSAMVKITSDHITEDAIYMTIQEAIHLIGFGVSCPNADPILRLMQTLKAIYSVDA